MNNLVAKALETIIEEMGIVQSWKDEPCTQWVHGSLLYSSAGRVMGLLQAIDRKSAWIEAEWDRDGVHHAHLDHNIEQERARAEMLLLEGSLYNWLGMFSAASGKVISSEPEKRSVSLESLPPQIRERATEGMLEALRTPRVGKGGAFKTDPQGIVEYFMSPKGAKEVAADAAEILALEKLDKADAVKRVKRAGGDAKALRRAERKAEITAAVNKEIAEEREEESREWMADNASRLVKMLSSAADAGQEYEAVHMEGRDALALMTKLDKKVGEWYEKAEATYQAKRVYPEGRPSFPKNAVTRVRESGNEDVLFDLKELVGGLAAQLFTEAENGGGEQEVPGMTKLDRYEAYETKKTGDYDVVVNDDTAALDAKIAEAMAEKEAGQTAEHEAIIAKMLAEQARFIAK